MNTCFNKLNNNRNQSSRLRLPRLVSDGMVLQRETEFNVWGWASALEDITIDFIDKSYTTKADQEGKWLLQLSALKAGGPYTMEIKTSKHSLTLRNILIGDVWVCSGQSNMELPMERVKDLYSEEIANCENSEIRQFDVAMRYDFNAQKEDYETGTWEAATPENILKFTATGYFFAKSLYEKHKVPIGLIKTCLGGSRVESWLSQTALKEFPNHLETAIKFKDNAFVNKLTSEDQALVNAWYQDLDKRDKGLSKEGLPWYDINYSASDWQSMNLPNNFEKEGIKDFNGAIWFRKEVDVPASMVGKPARLFLGRIIDSDTAYINGQYIGNITYQYPPRKYTIPEGLLKEGKNLIVVRVICNDGHGEFIDDKPYEIITKDESLDLKGTWQYKIGATTTVQPETTFVQWKPSGLFNGMLSPALKYTIKGVIWYQGESNASNAIEYKSSFPKLINEWRELWQQGDFPFLYVQLPNYLSHDLEPSESDWAELREAQLETLMVTNTAMAVAIDLGEWNDLHPLNKKEVGYRLSLTARKVAYGENIVHSGPIYKSMKIHGNKIILSFTNIGGGLVINKGNELKHFAIAGSDKKFIWAKAKIVNDTVVVWNDNLTNPTAVRYAWAFNPEGANLYNSEGLPASPFRTEK
jgi:sialate O-acetylesterase